jgi:hypothetical protein
MTEVAPLPADFPKPIDADTLPPAAPEAPTAPVPPARTPHPLELWTEPGPPIEPVISRPLEGGGYLNTTKGALAALEAAFARERQRAPRDQTRRRAGP